MRKTIRILCAFLCLSLFSVSASALLIVNNYGTNALTLEVTNNDTFPYNTIVLDFQNGYNLNMDLGLPGNLHIDDITGNVIKLEASPDVSHLFGLNEIVIGVQYNGPYDSIDFTDFNLVKILVDGTMTAFGPGGFESVSAPFEYFTTQLSAYSDPVGSGTGKVPEPATLLLMGIGLAGIGWKRRKAA